ncbi:MAG: hypothetical protein EXX96DRAFT_380529 [Benjaminiella poitrasii]|nr:MAG: hypothetical protein EXX96DRAFT_380529 [Benjaminiella poitrasii]
MEDTLKNLNTTVVFVSKIAQSHLDVSFPTFKKVQVFRNQSVKHTVTLSSTRIDITKVGHYCNIEYGKAEIPVTLDKKRTWLRVMELFETLTMLTSEQMKIMNILKQEQNREIYVKLRDTARFNLLLDRTLYIFHIILVFQTQITVSKFYFLI